MMSYKVLRTNIIRESQIFTKCLGIAMAKRCYMKTANTSTSEQNDERTTHFGFQTIRESEKAKEVHTVFENVANSYDLMNDAMSMGIHRIWKDIFMQELGPTHGTHLLDSAGGTGDITFRITWKREDAENLSFPEDSFTAYTIAFGVRNVTRIDKVLSEAYRVLQPGGRFLCLEFSHVTNETLQWLYDRYSFQIIPVMGQLIAGQWKPYQYLVESIRRFPKQEDFKEMIESAGFRNVTYRNLTCGMVAIHSGFKL
ncbi:2-methoxy-6-polyprenyl-1,4-benzoquinol methylase, mitochondrial isoform X2 [Ooceraea biroi]|uniref:2-methoxy-6-polyprenyl-1,4-benzoquinol methylase, mitochondrial isoform X2 n=1 Tax=Ooceraea biroi TaxID=2015173 RepID=UPI000F07A8F1|nr:2-methoxy-6-polyprenyl-1,4-benzoquinol methylase, mitochondrial isoform X2 [Ooceraea biroi]